MNTWLKRGAELLNDHHLVVGWIRWGCWRGPSCPIYNDTLGAPSRGPGLRSSIAGRTLQHRGCKVNGGNSHHDSYAMTPEVKKAFVTYSKCSQVASKNIKAKPSSCRFPLCWPQDIISFSRYCGSVGFVRWRPSAHAGAVFSSVWRGGYKNVVPVWGWAAAVSKQIKVSRGLVHMSEESSGVVLHTNLLKGELLEGLFLLHLT